MKKIHSAFAPFLGILILLAVWFLLCRAEVFSPYLLPTPQKVFDSFLRMLFSGELLRDVLISFIRILKGFGIAFLLAFLLGMFRALLPAAEKYYNAIVQFFRNVPPLSLIPLLILWCGIGETTKTVIIVLASFFPMYLNIVKGFTGCDQRLLEVGDAFGYTKFEKFRYILLPYASADILVGMRIGMGYSWRAIIAAEMIAASSGIGHLILFAQQLSRTDKVIVGIFVVGLVGLATDKCFGFLLKKLFKGNGENGYQHFKGDTFSSVGVGAILLLGKSGCGKTTLLRLVGDLEEPNGGEIHFAVTHKTAFVFQEPRLMPWLTVWDNTIFGLKKHSYDTGEIQTLLETVGLDGFQKAYPHQLSGGMQQRTAIARALAYAPSFLLMDEPFAALDHFTRTQLQKELIRLQKSQNTGILFVTHSIDEALLLGHKIAFLEDGCIKKEFLLDTDCENRDLLSKELIELKREILAQLHL